MSPQTIQKKQKMTSNKKEMLNGGALWRISQGASIFCLPCFCCKYDNYQSFAGVEEYKNEDIDYYYEKHCKEEPKSYFTELGLLK